MPAKGQDAMLASRYLAKLIGPLFIAIGAGMLLNWQVYKAMAEQYLASYALIYLSGLFELTVGIALVLAHNVWTPNWRILITLFGWLTVIGAPSASCSRKLSSTSAAPCSIWRSCPSSAARSWSCWGSCSAISANRGRI